MMTKSRMFVRNEKQEALNNYRPPEAETFIRNNFNKVTEMEKQYLKDNSY